jgi:hypothetical protein
MNSVKRRKEAGGGAERDEQDHEAVGVEWLML